LNQTPFPDSIGAPWVIWLAFASSCYLENARTSIPALYNYDYIQDYRRALNNETPIVFSCNSSTTKLPEKIVFLNLKMAHSNESTNAVYRVISQTNIGDYSFPTHSILKRFKRPTEKTQDKVLDIIYSYETKVTDISTNVSDAEFTPLLHGKTYVDDRRFFTSVRYNSTNWLDKDNVKKMPEYKMAMIRERSGHAKDKRKVLFRFIIVTIFVGTNFLFFSWLRKALKAQTKETK
jgi:hypothetical protein